MNQSQQMTSSLIWLALFTFMMYFLVIRPQQKQQRTRRQMMSNVKAGDKIVTLGGLVGTVTEVNEEAVRMKIADRVEVELVKTGIGYIKESR